MKLKEEKLAFIIQFAMEHFQKYGFSKVTMDELAKGTGTGKGTLYRYFPSKEDLLMAAVDNNIQIFENKLQEVLTSDKMPLEKLNGYIMVLTQRLNYLHTDQLADIQRNVPQAFQKIREARERLIFQNLASIIEEGKESGLFREDLDVKLVAKIILGASEYITKPEILDTLEHMNFTQLLTSLFQTIIKGCLSEEGRGKSEKISEN